ncbi:hypothetical protein [Halomicronema sp. CCY15110]|uniref:hypothetical protein n=1 Tax=Halomicronema sp. CCY15110 TaxID=2767773 RepID=UPI001950C8F2|nr:hypothetical protein [Halomicronema sp. CCY15110]
MTVAAVGQSLTRRQQSVAADLSYSCLNTVPDYLPPAIACRLRITGAVATMEMIQNLDVQGDRDRPTDGGCSRTS